MFLFVLNLKVLTIDNFLFQILFVFINIYNSIPLIKELIPPEFNPEQKELYKKYFKGFFKKVEFKYLLSKHRRRVIKVSSSFVQRGNGFTSVFFFAKFPLDEMINVFLKKGKIKIIDLQEHNWLGIIEYINLLKDYGELKRAINSYQTGVWGIDCEISFKKVEDTKMIMTTGLDDSIKYSEKEYKKIKNGLIIYEWDLEVIFI